MIFYKGGQIIPGVRFMSCTFFLALKGLTDFFVNFQSISHLSGWAPNTPQTLALHHYSYTLHNLPLAHSPILTFAHSYTCFTTSNSTNSPHSPTKSLQLLDSPHSHTLSHSSKNLSLHKLPTFSHSAHCTTLQKNVFI